MMRFILALFMVIAATAANAQSSFTANIHNAPGWQASHAYTASSGPPTAPFTRVVAGAGWTPGSPGNFNPGLTLNAYQLTSGNCTSGSSQPTWTTGTGISDGSCTWNYVSGVDYISITGWTLDNGSVWTTGTDYGYGHMVQTGSDLDVYQLITAGCHSTVQPTGTTPGNIGGGSGSGGGVTLADGCQWGWQGKIYYTSRAHSFPHGEYFFDTFQGYIDNGTPGVAGKTLHVTTPPATHPISVFPSYSYIAAPQIAPTPPGPYGDPSITSGSGSTWTLTSSSNWLIGSAGSPVTFYISDEYSGAVGTSNDLYTAQLWNDQEYVAGGGYLNSEMNPLQSFNHNYQNNDSSHGLIAAIGSVGATASHDFGLHITIKAAPGESFMDTFTANPGLALAGYNENYGVGLHATGVGVAAFLTKDNRIFIHGLQFKSDTYMGLTEYPGRACNQCMISHNIFEGSGTNYPVIDCGADCYAFDNLIIARSSATQGVGWDYGGILVNNTIVCPNNNCTGTAVINSRDWLNVRGIQFSGNAIFGFSHLIGAWANNTTKTGGTWNCTIDCATWVGSGNITDLASTDGSNYPATTTLIWGGNPGYVQQFATSAPYCGTWADVSGGTLTPGTCGILNGQSASATFVSWPGNYKISASSPAYGNGAAFGSLGYCANGEWPYTAPEGTWSGCTTQLPVNTPDIVGSARPQSARYDSGAFEVISGVISTPGRFPFRW